MDGSGGNRYELLFMDDDASDPLDTLVKKSKTKQKQKNAAATATATANNKQANQQTNQISNKKTNVALGSSTAEKENKSSAMNKNVEKKTAGGQGQGPVNVSGGQKQKGPAASGGAPVQFKDQSNYRNGQDQRQPREAGKIDRNTNFKQQNGETREQRNNRRNRDDRPPQQYQQQQQQQQQQNGAVAPGDFQQNTERPQRRGPPPRRNFDGARGGKREFDRQSGSDKTGVKAIDKRDGAGAHNWGSLKQDIEDMNKSHEEVTDKDDSTGDQQIEQQPVNVEEETKELTLDEWKAQRAVRAKPQYNIRKAGEGEDLSQWKKMVALNNKKREDGSEDELEYDPSMYPQRVGRLQRVLDIEFHFNDGRRGPGVRGRGRPRGQPGVVGGAGRQGRVPRNVEAKEGAGVERQQRTGQNAPKVDDEHDFPSLG